MIVGIIILSGIILFIISILMLIITTANSQILCPYCNQKLPKSSTYCTNCGQHIEKRN